MPRGGHPCGWHRLPYWWQGWLRATAPFGCPTIDPLCGHRAVSGCARRRLLPLAGAAGLPFGLAPVATNRPLAGGLGRGLAAAWPWVVGLAWGLAVPGRPSSSLPSLRKHSKNA
ncbi:hypothetical protein BHE74_00054739 [Ensete ventricosum]|nr:hypothetical protein BHE74_00054739 [Ensete ventricosum]